MMVSLMSILALPLVIPLLDTLNTAGFLIAFPAELFQEVITHV